MAVGVVVALVVDAIVVVLGSDVQARPICRLPEGSPIARNAESVAIFGAHRVRLL